MMRLRYLIPVLGLSSLAFAACTGDGEVVTNGDGGEAMGGDGATPGGSGGTSGSGGSAGNAGEGPGVGGGCAEEGTGTITVEVTGLPAGVDADISIEGPGAPLAVAESGDLEDVDAGQFTVTVKRVFDADPVVRTVFEPSITATDFCLADGGSQTIEVEYGAIPTSNKLWMPGTPDVPLAGFSSEDIAETAIADATVQITAPVGSEVAFDRDGNLWTFGATSAEAQVLRFPASSLGETGTANPDREINVPEVACIPAMRSMAFDMAGNLWLSVCGDEIHRIPVADLEESGDKTSDAMFNGAADTAGIAFDSDGNLWVAGGTALARFDAARLGEVDADPPDLALAVTRAGAGNQALQASHLAFDAEGNLWGVDFGGNTIFQVAAANLADTGEQEVEATVSFAVTVTALVHRPAFDDGGGLWMGLASTAAGGTFGRFSPEQLTMSAGPGAPVTPELLMTSTSAGSEFPVAFFPAAEGLPLFHALPEP